MKKIVLSITMVCASFAMFAQAIVAGISPAAVQGNYDYASQSDAGWPQYTTANPTNDNWGMNLDFSMPATYVQGLVQLVDDGTPGVNPQGINMSHEGCSAYINAAAVNGKIALVYRNTCDFAAKVKKAQDAGAIGVILINREDDVNFTMTATAAGDGPACTIPAVMLSKSDGDFLVAQAALGPVTMFIGNKIGAIPNDLVCYTQSSLLPKYYGVSSTLSQDDTEFNFDLGLRVYNYGTQAQNTITVKAEIKDPSNAVIYSNTQGPFALVGAVGGVIDSVDIDPTSTLSFPQFSKPTYVNGQYTLTYTVVNADNTDDLTYDNVLVSNFNINPYTHSYARLDANMKPIATTFYRSATGTSFTECLPFVDPNASRIGVDGMYFQATTNSVNVPSLEGSAYQLIAYKWNDDFVDLNDANYDFTALEDFAYGEYTFGADEEETAVYAKFDDQFLLEDGQRYLFCITGSGDSTYLGFDKVSKYNWNLGFYLQPIIAMSNGIDYFTGFSGNDDMAPSLALGIFPAAEMGIKETASIDGRAYPNPANNVVTISVDYKGAANLVVTDLTGRNALSKAINLESGKTDVDVSSLTTGMYIFNVTFENGQTSQFNVVKK